MGQIVGIATTIHTHAAKVIKLKRRVEHHERKDAYVAARVWAINEW